MNYFFVIIFLFEILWTAFAVTLPGVTKADGNLTRNVRSCSWVGFCPSDGVRFYLYYKDSRKQISCTELFVGAQCYNIAEVLPDTTTKILIHGFRQNGESSFPTNVKNSYLANPKSKNIIVVDWGDLSYYDTNTFQALFNFPQAKGNVVKVGKLVGNFILGMLARGVITLDDVHMVGFSLGAHIASNAGRYVSERSSGRKVGRITGLDPAGPGYKFWNVNTGRLQPGDAKFVDVIHTNTALLGHPDKLGHRDIFMYGGRWQPNCQELRDPRGDIVDGISCSHNAATIYFAMSIKKCKLLKPEIGECISQITRNGDSDGCVRTTANMTERDFNATVDYAIDDAHDAEKVC